MVRRQTLTLCLFLLAVTESIVIEVVQPRTVVVGGDADLRVTYASSAKPHVMWALGDIFARWDVGESTSLRVLETFQHRLEVNTSTASIVILGTTLADSGTYTVSLSALGERPSSRNVSLMVYELITNVKVTVPMADIKEGDPMLTLTCTMTTGTWDVLAWFKDGERISSNSHWLLASNELTIRNVIRGDVGTYSCYVQNPFNNGTAQESLRVYYGPDVPVVTIASSSDPSPEQYVLVNSTVTLRCQSESEPPALYFWSVGESEDTSVPDHSVLTLTRVQLDQAGTYSCIASNAKLSRSVRKTATLTVYELPEGEPRCSMVSIDGGTKLRFSCEWPGGFPLAQLQWLGLSRNVTAQSRLVQDEGSPEGLHRTNITCLCQHPAATQSCLLQPEAPLVVPSWWVSRGAQGKAMVTLKCQVTSDPAAIVRWFRDRAQLASSGNMAFSSSNSELHIRDFSIRNDTGNYSCSCRNPLGESRPTMELTAPRLLGLSVLRLNGTAVSLSWSLRPSDVVTSFLIQSRVGTQRSVSPSSSWSTLQEAAMSQRSTILTRLRADTGYSFRVIPVTGNQLGEASPTQSAAATVNSSLSVGAIVGIVLACVVGSALILILIVCLIRHQNRKKKTAKQKQMATRKTAIQEQNTFPQRAPASPSGATQMQNHKPSPKRSISNNTDKTTDGWDRESSVFPKSLYVNGPHSDRQHRAAMNKPQGRPSEKPVPPTSLAQRSQDSSTKSPFELRSLTLQQRLATKV